MSNGEYLQFLQQQHEPMRYFRIKDNHLLFVSPTSNNKVLGMPLYSISLEVLDKMYPALFYQNPNEIYQILFLLSLFYKEKLDDNIDIKYISDYIKQFINIKNQVVSYNDQTQEIRKNCLEIPLILADDNNFENNPCAIEIRKNILEELNDIASGKSNVPKLVRSNPNVGNFESEEDMLRTIEKAGFTTIFIIVAGVILTCAYLIYFFNK